MKNYLMAIDAGTGSVRAVLFDLKGNQIGCSQHEWTHNEDPRFPGSMDFDWKYNWELASGCVRNVLAETKICLLYTSPQSCHATPIMIEVSPTIDPA